MQLPQLEDLPDPSGRRVLVRADFNVPIKDGVIEDDLRIRAALPTIQWLQEKGAHVTACSHLGRPKGKADPKYSMDPVRARLAELAPGVDLLENLRFDPGEEGNDPAFVQKLIEGQDLYVDDAFGAAHRAHASIVGPPQFLPSAAGRLLAREVEVLSGLLESPKRPFVTVLGGAKVSDKLGVIRALLTKADTLLVGGGMCFTFFVAMGHRVGDSLLEADMVDTCKQLLADAGDRIVLPSDVVAMGPGDEVRQLGRSIPDGWKGLDVGPGTAADFTDRVEEARTVLWNGPMGVFEDDRFASGTRAVAEAVANCRGFTVVGGGDSASALAKFGLDDEVDHLSTGGGASLEFIEYGDLPGLEALRKGTRG
ncbi:MAG: phosphoglycerate kinase [Actinobacteria bacterium]|nr:phosphoglycerate kinase [Actinomycetota bacterium]